MRRPILIALLVLTLSAPARAYAVRVAAARPRLRISPPIVRHPPPIAVAENEDGVSTMPPPGGAVAWVQQNLLQGVALGPGTYAVMTVYFVQGVLGLASLARTYFLKDELGLGAAESSALLGVTALPWVIKPVYGFLTDGLPIFGLRRKPYLVIGGLLGASAWASLATVVETPLQVDACGPTHMHAHAMFMCERLRTRRAHGEAAHYPRRRWWLRRPPRSASRCRMWSSTRSWSRPHRPEPKREP